MLGRGELPGKRSRYRGGGGHGNRSEYDGGFSEVVREEALPPFRGSVLIKSPSLPTPD